jgi:hypothetical protein
MFHYNQKKNKVIVFLVSPFGMFIRRNGGLFGSHQNTQRIWTIYFYNLVILKRSSPFIHFDR